MNKNLLSILTEEDRLMNAIDRVKEDVEFFQRRIDEICNIPVECETKSADLAFYEGLIAKCRLDADEYRLQLDAVRDDLRAYLTELFKKEIEK